jgi:hypothetical protein
MPSFDASFVQAAAEELVKAMAEAVAAANKRCRVGKLTADEAAYRDFIHNEMAAPEGVRRWIAGTQTQDEGSAPGRATLLGVAWWTDPVGRKHVRVVGRRLEPSSEHHHNRFIPPGKTRPPRWLVHPERLFVRTLPGGTSELRALCGCGASGPPEALGWMGESCGPCHDHREEFGTPLARPALPLSLAVHEQGVRGVAWSASGATLISSGDEGGIEFWDAAAGTRRCRHEVPASAASPVGFACNGQYAWLTRYGSGCFCRQAEDGAPTRDVPTPDEGYDFLAVSPDGHTLAAGNFSVVVLWDLTQGKAAVQRWSDVLEPSCLTFSPDGGTLAVGTRQGFWSLFDVATGQGVAPQQRESPGVQGVSITAMAFSPTAQDLVVGTERVVVDYVVQTLQQFQVHVDGALDLYSRGKPAGTLHEGPSAPHALAFSPDGKVLAGGCTDGAIRLWDMPEGRPRGSLEWHIGTVQALAFSPGGECLASGGADGFVRLWPWKRLLAER